MCAVLRNRNTVTLPVQKTATAEPSSDSNTSKSDAVWPSYMCIINYIRYMCIINYFKTRMWANAQRDGRPVEYRWRHLFNAAKFGWCLLLGCRAVTLPRRESCWNLQGCPKLANRSQPLGGWSSPYCEDMWGRYRCLTSFFPIVDTCLSCEDTARQSCAMVPKWRLCASCIFSSRVQHISDMHSKFALRPHHVWKYGRHPISDRSD